MSALRSKIFCLLVALACTSFSSAHAQLNQIRPNSPGLARSISGQFIVHGGAHVDTTASGGLINNGTLLQLEPSYVVVSCERIKHAVTEELGDAGLWRGKIYISLQRAETTQQEITFIAERFRDGWNYRLLVPNPVEPVRFIRALVQALLLEQANRRNPTHAAEIPLWLTEGVTQQILATRGQQVLLSPPKQQGNRLSIQPTTVDTRRSEASFLARAALGDRTAMTLQELSWPKDNQLEGPDAELYRLSSQLFVAELLRLPEGRARMVKMLAELGGCYNWQTAFFRAFQPHFERQLDVEKWWTLQLVQGTGRNLAGLWSPEESWSRLGEILQLSVETRQTKTDLPKATVLPLATAIREWDLERQIPLLRTKLTELHLARHRTADSLLPLVDAYRDLLTHYVTQRTLPGASLGNNKRNSVSARNLVRDTLKQLAALEQQREAAQPAALSVTAKAGATPQP
jgi:hypothetical protein